MIMSNTLKLLRAIELVSRREEAKFLAAWNIGRANLQAEVAEAMGLEAEALLLDQKARGIAADLVEGASERPRRCGT